MCHKCSTHTPLPPKKKNLKGKELVWDIASPSGSLQAGSPCHFFKSKPIHNNVNVLNVTVHIKIAIISFLCVLCYIYTNEAKKKGLISQKTREVS